MVKVIPKNFKHFFLRCTSSSRAMWPKEIFGSVRKGYPKIPIVDLSTQTRFK